MITGKPFSDEEMDFFRKGGVFRQVTNTDVLDRPRWLATIDSLRAENARMREALGEVAKQRTIEEWKQFAKDEGLDPDDADFEGAYDAIVMGARAALAPKEPQQ